METNKAAKSPEIAKTAGVGSESCAWPHPQTIYDMRCLDLLYDASSEADMLSKLSSQAQF